MSGNENNERVPEEVPKDFSDAISTEPTDASKSTASNEDVPAVESSAASAVDEAKPSVSDVKENSEPSHHSGARVPSNRIPDLMKASNLHCPFVWRNDLDTSMYLDHELDLLSSAEEMFDDSGFRFRRFIINLVLCYHNFYKRNIKECMEHLDELDNMMTQSSKKNNSDYLFNRINEALFHCIHSCRIYILDTTEQKDRTQQILNKIKSYDTMSDANRAGLWAIRANVYVEYGYEGVKNAVSYMRKAVNIDPENPFWYFMKGMFMGRLRRMEGGQIMPENEEFQALRAAIEKREDPAFIAFAGEAYLETAKTAKRLHGLEKTDKDADKQVASLLQGLNEVAAKYFKRSIELKPSSSHLLFRCGKGLINLPPPHQDLKMGLDFLRKGLEITPDSGYGTHVMAMFLDKVEKNPTLAKVYLDISIKKKNFPAHMDMIRIEFQESKDVQKLWEELENLLKTYKEMPRRRKILGEMVCYYLFINYDLVEACFWMKKLIQMNSSSVDVINKHKTMILPIVSPIPLSDLIFNRIKAAFKDRKLSDLGRKVFTMYIQFLIDENIEPEAVKDEVFTKVQHQIELSFKKSKMNAADKRTDDTQKRVRGAHEFKADPCADEDLNYLDFYKDDLKDTNVGKTRGVGNDMLNMLHSMGQNPLPKRRFDEDMSKGDRREQENGDSSRHEGNRRRRNSTDSSKSSRKHRRRRSYSSTSSSRSSSSSSDRRSSRKHHRSSRSRRRSPSSTSSYSSSTSSSSDRYSKSSRRGKGHRRHSSSYDSKRSRDKKYHRDTSPYAKSRRQKKEKRDRSFSSSSSYSSETSVSSKSDSTLSQRSGKEIDSKKLANVSNGAEVATEGSHPVAQLPTSVDHIEAIMENLSIDSHKSSSTTANASKDTPDVVDVKNNSQNGDAHSGKVEDCERRKKSSKQLENREDSDGSVKTTTSRHSHASKRSTKRRSRDRSLDSVRTSSSRSSKKKSESSRKRRSSSSSSRSSSSRRHKSSEKHRTNSSHVTRKGDSATPNRSERRSKDDGRKDGDRKYSSKQGRRKEDVSDSNADSSSSRRDHSAKNGKGDRRSLPKESKYSEDEKGRRSRKEKDKTVSSQLSD